MSVLANSILYSLFRSARASAMAASPAVFASPSENFCPCKILSASSARHGTEATPPNTKRAPAKRSPSKLRWAATLTKIPSPQRRRVLKAHRLQVDIGPRFIVIPAQAGMQKQHEKNQILGARPPECDEIIRFALKFLAQFERMRH